MASEREIFDRALEILDPQERAEYLRQACGQDEALRAHIEGLLQAHAKLGGFLEKPPLADPDPAIEQPITEGPGAIIGPYKLLQKLGEGGFGLVYMAEQAEPVERRVALKIIKPGMDSRQVIARFKAEEQALAMMDHPNIARVFDAGITGSGRPYFVMELVKGVPITKYCDEQHLTPRQRLELFIPVCHAVQHAHQKGIIHRDLKPSNVLVALYDDKPAPKVIDFGVAKATSQKLAEQTKFTQYGQIVGTLEYMSPEQANLNQLDIDTRSDIYSLGVLLYELLTGETPFDRRRLHVAAFDEILRIIREEEPPRPSLRLSTSETLPSIAANRHIEPKRLSTLLRGDLDWIVMKALEKDRSRRYETANGLADDIERYLNDEAVSACPPSAAYRFRKFARRNKAAIVTASLIALALILGMLGTSWQAVRATVEHHKADLARREEAAQRVKVEEQRDRALKAEQRAEVQAKKAETAAGNERLQRAEAEGQRRLAEAQELRARRNLYAAHMNLARLAWDDADVPRVLDLLERHVPAPGEPDWRSFEWHYLLGLCNRDELTIPCGYSGNRPAFSPDGKTLAVLPVGTGETSWPIELWDLERRERIKVLEDTVATGPLAFSPDGTMLASGGGAEVKLWDVATGNLLRALGGHQSAILAIAFTPDGKHLVSTDGGDLDSKDIPGVIRVWDVATGERLHELAGHKAFIWSIAMSPDGERLVSVGRNEVRFWNLRTGEPIEGLKAPNGEEEAGATAWSSQGDLLATYCQGHVALWDAATGKESRRFPAPPLLFLDFSPDGKRLASAHRDSTVRLWDVATGAELNVYKGHSQWMFYVGFSPDGSRLASVGRDLNVKVWRVEERRPIEALTGANSRHFRKPGRDRVAISPDGELLAGLESFVRIAIVEVRSGRVRATFKVGPRVHAIVFSPDGKRLAVAHSDSLQIWDVGRAKLAQEKHSDLAMWTVAFSPDGRWLAVGTESNEVEIRRADTLAVEKTLPWKYQKPLRKVAFSPDVKTLAVATIGPPTEVHLWDVDRWRLRASYEGDPANHSECSTDLAFSPDGKTLAVSEGTNFQPRDGAATRLFDVATGRQTATLRGDDGLHLAVAFSRDGQTLVTASEQGEITLWDRDTLEERVTFTWEGAKIESSEWSSFVESIAISPDGRTLVSSDAQARVWLWRGAAQDRVDQRERAGLCRRGAEYANAGRWQEAVDLFSPILQRGDDPNVRSLRGGALAELGRWDEATADFERAASLGGLGSRAWYELALARLGKRDQQGYREACATMLAKYGNTTDPLTAERVAWTCALAPQSNVDFGKLLGVAAIPLARGEAGRSARLALGATLLRAGLYEDALEQLESAAGSTRQDLHRMSAEYGVYLLAVVYAHRGDLAQARKWLDQAAGEPKGSASGESANVAARAAPWNRRVTASLLAEEAESLIRAPDGRPTGAGDSHESPQRALALYGEALKARADVPLLWRLRAKAHERCNQPAEAEADLARARELEQQTPPPPSDQPAGGGGGSAADDRSNRGPAAPPQGGAAIGDA